MTNLIIDLSWLVVSKSEKVVTSSIDTIINARFRLFLIGPIC